MCLGDSMKPQVRPIDNNKTLRFKYVLPRPGEIFITNKLHIHTYQQDTCHENKTKLQLTQNLIIHP